MHNKGSWTIAPGENCPPTLVLTLTLNQTLPLTGGIIFFEGSCPGTHSKIFNKTRFVSQFRNKWIHQWNLTWKYEIFRTVIFWTAENAEVYQSSQSSWSVLLNYLITNFLNKRDSTVIVSWEFKYIFPQAALQRCSCEKVFWKYAANLQENTHAEMWFQ